jgi:mediator of RNA polymerase II transcription subunit 7
MAQIAVTPFPPPPRFYEDFEPHSVADFQMPDPPKPVEGKYIMFGTEYDTSFGREHPAQALDAHNIKVEGETSPVGMLRQLNRALPDEYLKLMEMLIDRPVICSSKADEDKVRQIDKQREKVEAIIGAMHLSLSRFRPFQARQALITALRAQVPPLLPASTSRRCADRRAARSCAELTHSLRGPRCNGGSRRLRSCATAASGRRHLSATRPGSCSRPRPAWRRRATRSSPPPPPPPPSPPPRPTPSQVAPVPRPLRALPGCAMTRCPSATEGVSKCTVGTRVGAKVGRGGGGSLPKTSLPRALRAHSGTAAPPPPYCSPYHST